MHRSQTLGVLLVSVILPCAAAQQQGREAKSSTPEAAKSSQASVLGPDTPILKIQGLCDTRPPVAHLGDAPAPDSAHSPGTARSAPGDCQTVLTKSRFENLMNALNPNTPPEKRLRFALEYSDSAVYAEQAQQLGLDKTPEFQELMKYKYIEGLGQVYKRYIQQKANAIPDSEVEKYYNEHPQRFEEFGLKRLFVPKGKVHENGYSNTPPEDEQATMKQVAVDLRKRALAGEDFDKLQDEAYLAAGDKNSSLATDLGDKWTRDNMPAGYQKAVLGLQPGQIADPVLFSDGWYIFKLVSRRMIPVNEAREHMEGLLINDLAKSLKDSVNPEVNRSYFNPGTAAVSRGPEGAK